MDPFRAIFDVLLHHQVCCILNGLDAIVGLYRWVLCMRLDNMQQGYVPSSYVEML